MKSKWILPNGLLQLLRELIAIICVAALAPGSTALAATQEQPPASNSQAAMLPSEQLDSLVAPIALYPDPFLAQVLAASTYPLEVIQLQQWLQMHKDLKEKALVDAVQKEDWDPSIQGLAALPDAVKQLAENIKWTTDLGNAFLAQQSDVMDAVQRMRMKADKAGTLKSSEQQKVETKVVESKTVVVIEQANPQVIYVPSYNPVVVYGGPVYPYPVIIYPPPPPAGVVHRHCRNQFRHRHGHRRRVGRRLGLRLRLGPLQQREHQRSQPLRQSLQQRPRQSPPDGHFGRQLAAQPAASRRRALPKPGPGEPVRRHHWRTPSANRQANARQNAGPAAGRRGRASVRRSRGAGARRGYSGHGEPRNRAQCRHSATCVQPWSRCGRHGRRPRRCALTASATSGSAIHPECDQPKRLRRSGQRHERKRGSGQPVRAALPVTGGSRGGGGGARGGGGRGGGGGRR